jgi:hypothetical protein
MIELILTVAAMLLFFSWRSACGTNAAAEIQRSPSKTYLPEDAVLRRHFVSQLTNEIEAALPPRPTDSVLRRHHQTLVAAKLQQYLSELDILRRC